MNMGVPDLSSPSNSTFKSPKSPIYVACGDVGNNEGISANNTNPISGSVMSFGSNNGAYWGMGSAICEFSTNTTALYFTATITNGIGAGGPIPGTTGHAGDSFWIMK